MTVAGATEPPGSAKPGLPVREMVILIAIVAVAFAALVVIGIVRTWDPLPYKDMWDGYLGFWFRLMSGNLGAWWEQHNEHRILLARVFFWLDLAVFHGAGWLLIVANVAAAFSIAAIFIATLRARLREAVGSISRLAMALLCGILIGLSSSWVQSENLLWGFQIQFFLAVLLPLGSLVLLAAARPNARWTTASFVASAALAAASIGTIASGLLVPFVATCLGIALRESRARIGMLLVVAIVCVAVYLNGYTPSAGSNPVHWLAHPVTVAKYVVVYLGAPVYQATHSLVAGVLSAILLLSLLGWSAYRWIRGRDRHRIATAMLAFAAYVMLGAVITALGRLELGTMQATSGRYATPVLAAWSATLVLLSPWILEQVDRHRTAAPAALGTVLVGILVAQLAVFADVRLVHFQRQSAALAIALGIPDDRAIAPVYPRPAEAVGLGSEAMRAGLTSLAQSPYRQLVGELGTRTPAVSPVACDGTVTLDGIVPGTRFGRLDGDLIAKRPLAITDGIARVLDPGGEVVGFAVLGQPGAGPAPPSFLGYVLADRADGPLRVAGTSAECTLPAR